MFLFATTVSAAYEILARYSPGQQSQTVQTLQQSTQQSTQQSSQSSASSSSTTSQIQTPSGYFLLTNVSNLTGKTSVSFTHPTGGKSLLISVSGKWEAFSATCTHQP